MRKPINPHEIIERLVKKERKRNCPEKFSGCNSRNLSAGPSEDLLVIGYGSVTNASATNSGECFAGSTGWPMGITVETHCEKGSITRMRATISGAPSRPARRPNVT